jgi:hypothetical protein
MKRDLLLVVLCGVNAVGCDYYQSLEICMIEAPAGSDISLDEIRLQQGTLAAFKALPLDEEGAYMDHPGVWFIPDQKGIVGVEKLRLEEDPCPGPTDVKWYFTVYGIREGQTTVSVYVGSKKRLSIPVEVTPP